MFRAHFLRETECRRAPVTAHPRALRHLQPRPKALARSCCGQGHTGRGSGGRQGKWGLESSQGHLVSLRAKGLPRGCPGHTQQWQLSRPKGAVTLPWAACGRHRGLGVHSQSMEGGNTNWGVICDWCPGAARTNTHRDPSLTVWREECSPGLPPSGALGEGPSCFRGSAVPWPVAVPLPPLPQSPSASSPCAQGGLCLRSALSHRHQPLGLGPTIAHYELIYLFFGCESSPKDNFLLIFK